MTQAEIISEVRALVQEISTDAGALLADAGNLLALINDAQEQVVMDLLPSMPDQLMGKENVDLVDSTQAEAFTTEFLWISKVALNITGEAPREVEIIAPLDEPYYMNVGEEAPEPHACYFIGSSIYWVPIPSASLANYATIWGVKAEAASMAAGGPTLLPRIAHRLIVYKTAMMVATLCESSQTPFAALYAQRLQAVKRMWWGRYQSKPKFIRESVVERTIWDTRDKALVDVNWPG